MVGREIFNRSLNLRQSFLATPHFVALLSIFLFSAWAIITAYASSTYQNIAATDSLAMIHVLFPSFWIIAIATLGLCVFVFIKYSNCRWLHILLLAQIALMLYFTPFYLSGFSWSPDSMWHGGVAQYMPEILSGAQYPMTDYAQTYPFSFLITYSVQYLFNMDIITYTLYIYPIVCTVLISLFGYFFASRITNPKTAFLALLLALPALHYIEPHVSPFSTGTILVLASLTLLTYKSLKALTTGFLLVIAITLSHPISPLFLGVYLFSAIAIAAVFRKKIDASSDAVSNLPRLGVFSAFLVGFWIFWTWFQAMPNYSGVQYSVTNALNLGFLTNLLYASEWTMGGQSFVYPQISQLGLAVYGVFLVFIMVVFLKISVPALFVAKKTLSDISVKRLILAFAALISAVMGYLLFLSSGERFLLGRGLLFFLLLGSICLATCIVEKKPKRMFFKTPIAFAFILLLICTFPIISYSKEAYNTFTPSANSGLTFLGNNVDLSQNTLHMIMDQQIANYANLTEGVYFADLPSLTISRYSADVIVLRVNGYFILSMRYDLNFADNQYTTLQNRLDQSQIYNKVYSNAKFEVYMKNS